MTLYDDLMIFFQRFMKMIFTVLMTLPHAHARYAYASILAELGLYGRSLYREPHVEAPRKCVFFFLFFLEVALRWPFLRDALLMLFL